MDAQIGRGRAGEENRPELLAKSVTSHWWVGGGYMRLTLGSLYD